jgi:trimeric autotransporter adhesin
MKRYFYYLIILHFVFFLIISIKSNGQTGVSINTDGTDPHESSILDIKSNDKGLLIPRVDINDLSTAIPITNPAVGLLVFSTNVTNNGFYYWSGASWVKISTGNNLSANLTSGRILIGDINDEAQAVAVSGDATITNAGVLTIENDAIISSKLANAAVTNNKIADNSVDGTKINLTGNTNGDLMYYNGTDWVRLASGANGEVLKIVGGTPVWSTDNNSGGTVTSVATGTGLTGGTITNAGTISIANSGVNTTQLADHAVTTSKIANDAVDNTKLSNMNQSLLKGRASGAGTGDPQDLTAAQVRTILNVADGANNYTHPNHTGDVTSTGDGATTITNNAVTTAKIANDAVTSVKIIDDAVNNSKLSNMATQRIKGRTTAGTGDPEDLTAAQVRTILNVADGANNYTHPNHTGDVTSTGDGATTITNNAVITAKINNAAVTNPKLANMPANTVKGNNTGAAAAPTDIAVGTNTVLGRQGANIVAAQVVSEQIANNAVITAKITNANVTNAKLANMPANTLKGNNTGAAAVPLDLTVAQTRAMLGLTDAATGTGVANKVAFWTGANTLSNNTNFHWDNTNARLGIGTAAPSGKLHVSNDFVLGSGAGRVRKYASSISSTQGGLIKMGEFTMTGNSQNLLITGKVYGQSGGNAGESNFSIMIRSNTLPAKNVKFWQVQTNAGFIITVRVFNNTATGQVVVGFQPSGTLQSFGWDITVIERGNYTYWQNQDTYLALDPTGLTEITATGANHMYFNNGGNIGIGLNNPSAKLHVNGTIRSNAINETSDIRFKKNIQPIEKSLNKILQLEGVTYNWRKDEFPDNNFNNKLQYGLIAQDLEKVIPELVNTDDEGWKSVEYSHVVPLLIEAIKEQQDIIENQKKTILSNSEKIELQTEKLNSLSSQNNLLEKRLSEFEIWKNQLENSLPKSMLPNKD